MMYGLNNPCLGARPWPYFWSGNCPLAGAHLRRVGCLRGFGDGLFGNHPFDRLANAPLCAHPGFGFGGRPCDGVGIQPYPNFGVQGCMNRRDNLCSLACQGFGVGGPGLCSQLCGSNRPCGNSFGNFRGAMACSRTIW